LAGARRALETLAVREEERHVRERESWEVVRRLSSVLAGGGSRGRGGENVLRDHLSQLPPGLLVTDLRVNGRVVEFGLLLPDGRRLPIDSKWTALAELEALEAATDPDERETRAREVERQVTIRAREVAQYLDPGLTAPVAVAAVPDAAYGVLRRAHADAFARGVVIVPYSTAMPVLLFLYSLAGRFGDAGDAQAALAEVSSLLDAMESVLENKIAKAATMVSNGADDLRSGLGKARASVARGRNAVAAGVAQDVPHLEVIASE
jgi:DNA recombination protein RmuC